MRKIHEVLRLHHECGRSNREIARAVGLSDHGCRDLRRARLAGLAWPLDEALTKPPWRRCCFRRGRALGQVPGAGLGRGASPTGSVRRHPRPALAGVPGEHPDGLSVQQLLRALPGLGGALPVTLRQSHAPGSGCLSTTPADRDGHRRGHREERQAQVFVAVLGASSYTYVEATWSQRPAGLDRRPCARLRVPRRGARVLVPDNLKSGVTKPCRYEPDLNPSYQDLASHYGVAVHAGAGAQARDKAKVEAGVLLAERWILARLRHQRFFSLRRVNTAIRPLLEDLNRRPFKKLPGSRQSAFSSRGPPGAQAPAGARATSMPSGSSPGSASTITSSSTATTTRCPTATPGEVDVRFTGTTVEVFHQRRAHRQPSAQPPQGRHTTSRRTWPRPIRR